MLHKNGANFYCNKGTAIQIWNLILHIGLMSIKAVSWINSTFEKPKFRLTFTWKCLCNLEVTSNVVINANSITHKKAEISAMADYCDPDLMLIITETKLDSSIFSSELLPKGYVGEFTLPYGKFWEQAYSTSFPRS